MSQFDAINMARNEVKQARRNHLLLLAWSRCQRKKREKFLCDSKWYKAVVEGAEVPNKPPYMLKVFWSRSGDEYEVVSLTVMQKLLDDMKARHREVV